MDLKDHWNKAYISKDETSLGWFEAEPEKSLELIRSLNLDHNSHILDAGSGASRLVDELLDEGFQSIYAVDLSESGLNVTKKRLGEKGAKVNFIVDDLSNAQHIPNLDAVDLWHDRAVLHFLTDEIDQVAYSRLVNSKVKSGGHVIIAVFAPGGAKKCNGLDIKQYAAEDLSSLLGTDFELIKSEAYTFYNPNGDPRPYTYAMFKKK